MKTFLTKNKNKKSIIQKKSHKNNSKTNQILELQRKYGNREVQRLIESGKIQAALKVSNPNDIHEKEADAVAEKVMKMENEEKKEEVKTKCKDCENQEKLQTKPLIESITPKIQKQENEKEKEEIQTKKDFEIHRQPMEEEEKEIQAKRNSGKNSEITRNIESQIKSAINGGRELPQEVNRKFAPKFGVNFSDVKIHNDSSADKLARSINARAFTYRNHIFFSSGEYSPHTPSGKRLLAHELTHVVQQSKSESISNKLQRSPGLCQSENSNRKFHSGGIWNGNTTLSVEGGQGMCFEVKNLNILGTTISISDQYGQTKGRIIPPQSSVKFVFSIFGCEPISWRFRISTNSDAFLVGWKLYSTWVPGDPPNC